VGTPTGATVPEADISEARYKVDAAGQKVVSKLNEDMLRDIAAAGGGKYFNISHERKAVREIQRSIKWSDTNSQEDHIYSQYKSYFQWFLFPAILLLMLELAGVHILSYRENKSVRSFFILFMIIPLIIACGSHTSEATANQYFQDKDYHAAVKTYEEILQKDSALVNWYNLGTSYLKLTELDSAISILQYVLELQPDSNLAFKSNFNLGVAYYEQEEYSQSVNAFKNALKFEPNNYRSQYNLSLALSHILPQDQDQDDDNSEENSNYNDKDGDQDEDQSVDDSQSEGEDGKQDNSNETKDDQSKEENEGSESESKQRENQQNNLSPMDMLKLYQSLDQQEKNIQRRLMEQQGKNQKHPLTEKDW
ncbi:MAG TPA: tetratricopeptide repeat protein, partial [Chitinophagales bacterium]|nr:tetratricopeptide repeat protein [Chitinophagales bacterium]